jgi:hypothetical protein
VKGERKLFETLFGAELLHKLVKLSALVIPSIVALISDLTHHTDFFIPVFAGGFLTMVSLIYHNISRAHKSD